MNDNNICGAKTKKDGSPCQRKPAEGSNRCNLHGGKSPKGIDSPNYKHGLYSKHAGKHLKDVLADLDNISSEDLIKPEQEIRLMSALVMKCKALESKLDDLKELDTISKVIDRLITAKQRSQAIMIEQNRLIPSNDIEKFLSWMEELLVNRIGEEQAFDIMHELENFRISDYED